MSSPEKPSSPEKELEDLLQINPEQFQRIAGKDAYELRARVEELLDICRKNQIISQATEERTARMIDFLKSVE